MYESTVAIVAEIGSDTPSQRPHEPTVGLCVVPFDARPRNTALRGVNVAEYRTSWCECGGRLVPKAAFSARPWLLIRKNRCPYQKKGRFRNSLQACDLSQPPIEKGTYDES